MLLPILLEASKQITMEQVNNTLHRFWEVDNDGVENLLVMTKGERSILKKVKESVEFSDGHYQIAIPWKENQIQLPNNYKMAIQRLQSPSTVVAYSQVIERYLEKGYVRKVDQSEEEPANEWYLPHFPVIKFDRETTKTRIVSDASAKCNGVSLNDVIYQGPKLQTDLFNVLLRFRRYPVAIACDISEMYLRVRLHPKDKSCHRFLWRDLYVYEFTLV